MASTRSAATAGEVDQRGSTRIRRKRRSRQVTSSDLARSKDITLHPGFRGEISRALWRFWMCRLTPAGQCTLGVTALFFAFGSNSLQVQAYIPVAYIAAVWIVAILGLAVGRPRVDLKCTHMERIRAGETLAVYLDVRQLRGLAAELRIIPHKLPPGLDAIPTEGTPVPALRVGEVGHVRLGIRCSRRGVFHWGGSRVETDFPLGILRAYRNYVSTQTVLVYPGFTPLTRLKIPAGRRYQPGGVAMSSDLGESFEYIGNRDYREGDNVRDIDWVATARLNSPIVREYRDEYFLRVGVVLDTYLPAKADTEAEENFERAVSVCASVSDYMARSDYVVDIFAAGPNLYHLTAGRGLAYLDQILDILACVENTHEEPFAVLEPALTDYLTRLTTVICVFMDWDEARRDFVHRLATRGTGVKVIIVRDSSCTLTAESPDSYDSIPTLSRSDCERGIQEL